MPSAPPTTSTPNVWSVYGTWLPSRGIATWAHRKIRTAPATTRTPLRSRGETRSPTRTGTRKSAIVSPFSAAGTRVMDGSA